MSTHEAALKLYILLAIGWTFSLAIFYFLFAWVDVDVGFWFALELLLMLGFFLSATIGSRIIFPPIAVVDVAYVFTVVVLLVQGLVAIWNIATGWNALAALQSSDELSNGAMLLLQGFIFLIGAGICLAAIMLPLRAIQQAIEVPDAAYKSE